MLIQLIEYRAREALLSLIEEINRIQTSVWGLVFIKRRGLRLMTNDEFSLALKPAFADVAEARIFSLDNGDFYAVWRGMQKRVHDHLRSIVDHSLLRQAPESDAPSQIIYFDPQVMGNELITLLKGQQREQPMSSAPILEPVSLPSKNMPKPTAAQMKAFQKEAKLRQGRKQLEILVVEDQQLLRRLLHEVLRGEHAVDSVASLHEGWSLYLEKAPDVAFLDIGLADGSGHDLAASIKALDPESCVVMVTANNTSDEMEAARHNHADGFVAKPYSKQQIFDCIDRHISVRRLAAARNKYA